MKTAFVFPGQGSQFVGMGAMLANTFPECRLVFEEVDEALGEPLSKLIWEGELSQLTLTRNAQPAIMATSVAALKALASEGISIYDSDLVAGHSLGEYSALCATKAFTIFDCAKLLRIRGDAMQTAVKVGEGGMAAILGLSCSQVNDLIQEVQFKGVCEVANDNEPSQVVISGHKDSVDLIAKLAKERGAKRALSLPVSAPFHCSLMSSAKLKMLTALEDIAIQTPVVPLVSNVTALPISDPVQIRSRLVEQVVGLVRWRETVNFMRTSGISRFVEIGAGKVLLGLIRRTISKSNLQTAEFHAVGEPLEVEKIGKAFHV